jgi:dTDP-4-dehydrorhamnose 3,5-epimerase
MSETEGIQDAQSVTADGESVDKLIDGVIIRYGIPVLDERGCLTEMYDNRWGINDEPMVTAYLVTIRPGIVKGWQKHKTYTDRSFFFGGAIKIVLYDDRPESPTYKQINEIFTGEERPALVIIPPNVYHAFQNTGVKDVVFCNMPTKGYDHKNPDKWRLEFNNDKIPYEFGPVKKMHFL